MNLELHSTSSHFRSCLVGSAAVPVGLANAIATCRQLGIAHHPKANGQCRLMRTSSDNGK
jgi:hypothetical protein